MNEDLEKAIELIEQLDLILLRQRGQWVCGQLVNANGESVSEQLDLKIGVVRNVSGRLKYVGIASTIALAVRQTTTKLGN